MSWGSLSQFSPNLQQPMPTIATLSRMASGLPIDAKATTRGANMQPESAQGAARAPSAAAMLATRSVHDDGLHVDELAEAPFRELAAVAGLLDAAVRHARVRPHVAVDGDGAGLHGGRDPLGSRVVARPDGAGQAIDG